MHPLAVLDESQDHVALLECPAADSAAVIAAESLLVDCSSGEGELSCLLEKNQGVLTIGLVVFFDVVGNPRRVVLEVGWHDGLRAVHHEERGEASRSVWRSADAPQDGGELVDPAPR